ncbi:MFS transporter [Paracerasibacillus soli]|uniref:MFS transporter n=1 Tax=Paracerasibacillus soli TaxID=480284 RepID=A0ABU5CV65_9BACI|nr:MFS transporter [Virgibacillus soli]MDY0410268.1 MFS transporter [Virgibacillus soli]
MNLVYYCYFFGFPTFLQQVKGYSEEHTGLIMLALAGLSVVSSPIAGRIIDKYGAKLPMIIGAFLLLIGTGLLLTYHETSPLSWFLVIMAVLGMSNGFNNIATQTALYDQVDAQDTGTASGLFQMSRYFGSIFLVVYLELYLTAILIKRTYIWLQSFVLSFVLLLPSFPLNYLGK